MEKQKTIKLIIGVVLIGVIAFGLYQFGLMLTGNSPLVGSPSTSSGTKGLTYYWNSTTNLFTAGANAVLGSPSTSNGKKILLYCWDSTNYKWTACEEGMSLSTWYATSTKYFLLSSWFATTSATQLTAINNISAPDGSAILFSEFARATSSTYRRYYHLNINSFDPGASGASWVDASATTLAGYQLDAAGETLEFNTDVHNDWDGATNPEVEIYFITNASGGTSTSTVDLKLVSYYLGTDNATTTKTQTNEVATTVGTNDDKMLYKAEFELDWDASGNVIEKGDIISFILNLETDTSEVDDITITNASFYYKSSHIGVEGGDT